MSRSNPPSWGLKIPGRPPTPSEGYAQQYDRIGPAETQKLWTFDNGTCLTYGPDDLVDEFDPFLHPFCNQIALIDTLIRDNIAVRARYEVSKRPQLGRKASPHSDMTAIEEDPFNNFRQRHLDPSTLPQVTLASGVYLQVPSRFASISNMVSVFATPNKSDTPGEAHRGLTNDTRFGMCGRPTYNPQLQLVQRQENIHRLTLQRQFQSGASRGGRRGRGGRQLGPQQLARIPEQYRHQNGYNDGDQQQAGLFRGQQKTRGRGGRGKRKDSIHRHERFRSQAYSVADTPFSNFVFPIINNSSKKFALQDYEDEGPTIGSPYGRYGHEYFQENEHDADGFSKVDNTEKLNLADLRLNEEDMAPIRRAENYPVHKAFREELETHPHAVYGAPADRPSQIMYPPVLSQGTNYSGVSQSNHPSRRIEGYPPPISPFQVPGGSATHPVMYTGQESNAQDDDNDDNNDDDDEDWQDRANAAYGKYLDELNNDSRARGDIELAGDIINQEPTITTHFQTEIIAMTQNPDHAREPESDGSPTNRIVDSFRARRFRPAVGGSSTRPPSPSTMGKGRLSDPLRNRPHLGTGSLIGDEDADNLSSGPSPIQLERRPFNRRLFE